LPAKPKRSRERKGVLVEDIVLFVIIIVIAAVPALGAWWNKSRESRERAAAHARVRREPSDFSSHKAARVHLPKTASPEVPETLDVEDEDQAPGLGRLVDTGGTGFLVNASDPSIDPYAKPMHSRPGSRFDEIIGKFTPLHRAIILSEILGPPRAVRRQGNKSHAG
jgi:hypothetical protein